MERQRVYDMEEIGIDLIAKKCTYIENFTVGFAPRYEVLVL